MAISFKKRPKTESAVLTCLFEIETPPVKLNTRDSIIVILWDLCLSVEFVKQKRRGVRIIQSLCCGKKIKALASDLLGSRDFDLFCIFGICYNNVCDMS